MARGFPPVSWMAAILVARFVPIHRAAAILFATLLSGPALARTWSVLPDGSGEAPTIQAAVDSADDGDTISLGDGTFTGDGNRGSASRGSA